jgi:hypothetical protein
MVLQTDLAPTLLDLASAAGSPARLHFTPDGTSMKTLLQYPTYPWRRQGLIEHFAAAWPGDRYFLGDQPTLFSVRTSFHNTVAPNRSYTEYFSGMQYSASLVWPAGFYREACQPDKPPEAANCPDDLTHRVPVRPFVYTPDQNPDRLPDREYYNLDLDPFELTNGFSPGSPTAVRDAAAAESSTLRCRLDALVTCAGRACQAAEWAADCPLP